MIKTFKKQNIKTNLLSKFVFIIAVFLIWVNFVNAQIVITEIMYNPEGSDTGKEWIEIYNNGNETVDLVSWKLFEANTNHKINPIEESGSLQIPANSYALIIDKIDKFNENYPSFSGLIFDSAYSLLNTGENLIIRDSELNDIDSVNYVSDLGADGDGNSLQLIKGNWISRSPTPGVENNSVSQNNSDSESSNVSQESVNSINNTTNYIIPPQIFVDAGGNRKVIAGADTIFKANAVGVEKEPLLNARYSWSFGDGSIKEGENILYAYQYPNEYVVVLNVSSGESTVSNRFIVEVSPADIIISSVDNQNGFIELNNKSNYELDLSWWRLRSGDQYFTIPKDTIVLPNKKIKLSSKITNLNLNNLSQIYLLYPNGEVVNHYNSTPAFNDTVVFARKLGTAVRPHPERSGGGGLTAVNNFSDNSSSSLRGGERNEVERDGVANQKDLMQNSLDEEQLALIGNIGDKNNKNLFNKWTFSLIGLILISVVGVLFMKETKEKDGENPTDDELKPEDFKIIE